MTAYIKWNNGRISTVELTTPTIPTKKYLFGYARWLMGFYKFIQATEILFDGPTPEWQFGYRKENSRIKRSY